MPSNIENPVAGAAGYFSGDGHVAVQHGEHAFSTNDAAVEIPTILKTIISGVFTPQQTRTQRETLYSDLVVTGASGQEGVTVTREAYVNREFHFALDDGQMSSFNILFHPLFIVDEIFTLTQVELIADIAITGTPVLDIGTVADDNHFVAAQALSVTNGALNTITTFASTDVQDGEVVHIQTSGGTGGGPLDVVVVLSGTSPAATLTSGLIFEYILYGYN